MSPTIAQFHDGRTCKISEHIICSSVSKHVETHGTINDDQHGFRKNRSCKVPTDPRISGLGKAY